MDTPLHIALSYGCPDSVKLLMKFPEIDILATNEVILIIF